MHTSACSLCIVLEVIFPQETPIMDWMTPRYHQPSYLASKLNSHSSQDKVWFDDFFFFKNRKGPEAEPYFARVDCQDRRGLAESSNGAT